MIVETQSGSSDPVAVSAANPMPVNVLSGGIPASSDESTFTAGTTQGLPVQAVFNDGLSNLGSGQIGALRMSAQRALLVALAASTEGGYTPSRYVSTNAAPAAVQLKSSGGKVGAINATNNSASTWAYLKLWDASSSPTVGSTAPNFVMGLPPAGGNVMTLPAGLQFQNGIYFAITANAGDADTTAVGTAQVVASLGYY